jgi:pentose-5-phosphate-3-epimerase
VSYSVTDRVYALPERLEGRGGQKFLERCVPKVAELRERFPSKDIEVDGGVGPNTVDACTHAGERASYTKGWVVLGAYSFSAHLQAATSS